MNNYNQIKGRNMTSYFGDNFMKKIEGNGESIYFALNDEFHNRTKLYDL